MNKRLIAALLWPIFCLLGLMSLPQWTIWYGTPYFFKVNPFDPRSLLSGHYVRYRVDYGINARCTGRRGQAVYLCLKPSVFLSKKPQPQCKQYIRGRCRYGQFIAGIERFYLPELAAKRLPALMKAASIEVRVGPWGQARVTELLFNGKPWQAVKLSP